MTVTVTMLQTRKGEGGTLWTAGNSYSASDAFAQYLISSNLATGTLPSPAANFPTEAETTALRALVSGAGNFSMVLLGDSITDMCGGLRTNGTWQSYSAHGYWTWANALLGHRFWNVINAGVSGDNLAGMDARFATDVAPYAPAWVHLFGGVNDVLAANTGNQAAKLAAMKSSVLSIYSKVTAVGAKMVVGTVGPLATGVAATTAMGYVRGRFNQWLREFARATRNVALADYAAAATDPTTSFVPVGQADGNSQLIYDNLVHPTAAGAMVWGKTLYTALLPFVGATRPIPFGAEPGNYATNPVFTGASGATAPTGFTTASLTGTATTWSYAYSARTDGPNGNKLTATLAGGDAQGPSIKLLFPNPSIAGDLAIGSTVRAAVEIDFTYQGAAETYLTGLSLSAMTAGFGYIQSVDIMRDPSINTGGLTRVIQKGSSRGVGVSPGKLTLVTPPMVIPATTASLFCEMNISGTINPSLLSWAIFDEKWLS